MRTSEDKLLTNPKKQCNMYTPNRKGKDSNGTKK